MTSPAARGRRARRMVLLPILAVLAAGVLAVSAYLGGFRQAPPPEPESLGRGAEVDQGRMRTKFLDAVVRAGGHDGIGVPDKRYLEIVLDVTNQSDRTISAYTLDTALPTVLADGKVIKPKDPSQGLGPRYVVSTPGHAYSQLHPGVPAKVIIVFELGENEPAPKAVRIAAGLYEWRETFFSETHEWTRVYRPKPPSAQDAADGGQSLGESLIVAEVGMPVRQEAA